MSNRADISIRLTGSSAGTIQKRASALDQLAMSVGKLSVAANRMPNVSNAATQYATGLKRAQKATRGLARDTKEGGNALDNFGTLFARMVRIMAAFTIITVVTGAIRDMVVALVQAPAQMELWNAQLRTLSGSATIAAEKLKLLQTVAIETPLELPDLFQGLTTLKAFNVEMSDRTLPLIADLAAVSGRTFQDISEVVGKVIQGSATAITRSLPTIGIDPKEFRARAEEIGNRADALFQIIEERFKGFARESALTTIGIVSNIKDAAFVIAADVGEGLLGAFRPIVQEVFRTLEALRNNDDALDALRARLFGVGQSVVQVARSFVSFGQALGTLVGPIMEVTRALGGLKTIVVLFLGFKFSGTILTIAGSFRTLFGILAGGTSVFALISGGLAALNPFVAAGIATLAAAGGLMALWSRLKNDDVTATSEWSNETQLAAIDLERMNQAMKVNVGLMLDAVSARRQVASLDALRGRADNLLQNFQFGGTGSPIAELARFRELVGPILSEAEGLFSGEGFDQQRGVLGSARDLIFGGTTMDEVRQGLALVSGTIASMSVPLAAAADEAERFTEALEAAIVPAKGFVGQLTDEEQIAQFVDSYKRIFENLKTQFALGTIDQAEYVRLLREGITAATRDARDLFAREGDLQIPAQAAAAALATMAEGGERIIERFETDAEKIRQGNADWARAVLGGIMDNFERALEAGERAADRVEQVLTSGIKTADQRLRLGKLQFELGEIDEASFQEMIRAIKRRLEMMLDIATANGDLELQLEIKTKIANLDAQGEKLSNALESVLRKAVGEAANAVTDILANIISPKDGETLGEVFKRNTAGLLNAIGDTLIQAGIASEAFRALIAGFGLPGVGLSAIAVGIALKAFAGALSNSVSNSTGSASSSGSVSRSGPVTFPTPSFTQQPSVSVTITAMDSEGVKQFIDRNIDEFGRAVATVARSDRATGGSAYGAFQPV